MPLSAFEVKTHRPGDDDLRAVLGAAYGPWSRLVAAVTHAIGPITELWAFTSAKTGWGLRLRRGDRVILYMTPQHDQFLVSLVLGAKAVAAAQASRLPASVRAVIDAAPQYAEGRGVRFTVKHVRQVSSLVALARIKSDH